MNNGCNFVPINKVSPPGSIDSKSVQGTWYTITVLRGFPCSIVATFASTSIHFWLLNQKGIASLASSCEESLRCKSYGMSRIVKIVLVLIEVITRGGARGFEPDISRKFCQNDYRFLFFVLRLQC